MNSEKVTNHPVIEPYIPSTSDTQSETTTNNNKSKILVKTIRTINR